MGPQLLHDLDPRGLPAVGSDHAAGALHRCDPRLLGLGPLQRVARLLVAVQGTGVDLQGVFQASNFVRSTSLGAIKQGLALAVGYWCAPPATKLVHSLVSAIRP